MEKKEKREELIVEESRSTQGQKRCVNRKFAVLGLVIAIIIAIVIGTTVAVLRKGESKARKAFGCDSFSRPALILIYADGFRADYLDRGFSPTISQLAKNGVRAAMRSQFPTKSSPNQYSIVTGLYPESHGIVANYFMNKARNDTFAYWIPASKEGKWWKGEPIWETAKKQGVKSAVYYFWPENIEKERQPEYWIPYGDGKTPYATIADKVLKWLDLEATKRPYFLSLYFEDPDTPGHLFGPDSKENNAGIKKVDGVVSRLVSGIQDRQLDSCTNIMIVSDHGMANVSCSKRIYLDKMIQMENISVTGTGPFVSLYTKNKGDTEKYTNELKCKNNKFRAYSRDDIYMPKRYHYANNKRIGDIILVPETGWTVYSKSAPCLNSFRGAHGYDNTDPLMRALFVANGPSFKKGIVADEFLNTELYNLMAEILQLNPAPNNGTKGRLSHLLKKPLKSREPSRNGDDNKFSMDCKFPKNITEALKNCSYCTCPYCSYTILANLTQNRKHLDLSPADVKIAFNEHQPWGIPQGGAGIQGCILPQRHYITGYSGYLHIPLWVAYKMTAKQLSTNLPRKNCFRRDLRLIDKHSSFCLDYSRSGYDRGHMAPSGDFNFDRFAEQDTYMLSNIAPQSRYFNRYPGLWFRSESLFRDWAFSYDPVYVMSGSIFDADNDGFRDKDNQTKRWTKNKKGGVAIPTHFYKIIIRCNKNASSSHNIFGCNGGSLESLSFVFPHNEEKMCKLYDWKNQLLLYTTTIDDIEKLTGSHLFPNLPKDFAIQFKTRLPTKLWPIPKTTLY